MRQLNNWTMKQLKLYNSLTRKIEPFKPLNPPKVGIYTCGPTVYDYAHIGHARTYVFADLLRKVLLYSGYKVKQVMNITDVGHLTEADRQHQERLEQALLMLTLVITFAYLQKTENKIVITKQVSLTQFF